MLKEPVTNVKPIDNRLVKSVTDQCLSVTDCLSLLLIAVVLVTGYKVRYRYVGLKVAMCHQWEESCEQGHIWLC
jgi:hypothetical protein